MSVSIQTAASAGGALEGSQPRTRPTQGTLVELALEHISPAKGLIDIGVNLTDKSFDKDREGVVKRALNAGVTSFIMTGCCTRTSQAVACLSDDLALEFPEVYFTAGVHPHNARNCNEATIAELTEIAQHPRCVAIGECGLDFNRNFSPPDVQEEWFVQQIQLAEKLNMPMFMHCRDAFARFAELLRKYRETVPGVIHCFTGNKEELLQALDLGLHIGITGWVCDDRPDRGGAALAALLPLIPDDRLLVETDAPYLTPRNIRSSKARPSRNEPALLPYVVEIVAKARNQSVEHVAEVTTANAQRLFRLKNDES